MGQLLKPTNLSSKSGDIRMAVAGGVPSKFTKVTTNTLSQNIVKGQMNILKLFPRVVNEHVENSDIIQSVVSSNNIVGQVFKASKDNITALFLHLESAAGVSVNDFEDYIDSTALQVVWNKEGVNDALLETSIVKTDTKSMKLPGQNINDSWVKTISAIDYTNHTFGLDFRQDKEYNRLKYEFFIGDGINRKYFSLVMILSNNWEHFNININSMIEDGGITDVTAITEIGFRVVDKEPNKLGYVDNIVVSPPPGELEIKLRDMGDSIPVDGVTKLSEGVLYEKIGVVELPSYTLTLEGGKQLYHIEEFNAGQDKAISTNVLLTIDNYYILELHYIDTDVNVYGSKNEYNSDYYNDGFAFTVQDDNTVITTLGQYSDLMFGIMSRQDVFITQISCRFNEKPGEHSRLSIFLEDIDLNITDMVVDCEHSPDEKYVSNINLRPMFLKDGGKVEFYYNDDYNDNVTRVNVQMSFLHVKNIK